MTSKTMAGRPDRDRPSFRRHPRLCQRERRRDWYRRIRGGGSGAAGTGGATGTGGTTGAGGTGACAVACTTGRIAAAAAA